MNLINRACQVVRRGPSAEDDYGNEIPSETVVSTVCEFQAATSSADAEDRSQNNLAEGKFDVFFPVGTDVTSGDALILDGVEYEIDGEPWVARNPSTGVLSHVEAQVVRVAGSEDGS